jgi:catechol 2,3-dioxygenase-like lactoylglutathione lyase family enzyme
MRRFMAILSMLVPVSLYGQVVGVGTFIHVVANLDRTMHFYGDDLGLELNGAPGPRAFSVNAVVENLYDAKGSQSRVAVFKIPGSPLGVEFVEFKDVQQHPVTPRLQDPGASVLKLSVRDLDNVLAKLKQDGVAVTGHTVRDPDGFFIQLVSQPAAPASLALTINHTDETMRLYRDLLGFQIATGDKNPLTSRSKVPGTTLELEFVEFTGVERAAHNTGIHDPGAGVLRLVVSDVDTLLKTLKAAGVPVVSVGGEPVTIGANRHFVILGDPNHFFFQLVPAPPTP